MISDPDVMRPLIRAHVRRPWLGARDPFSGFSHLLGLGLALFGSVWLTIASTHHRLAALVYATGLVSLYAASAAYHLVSTSARATAWLRRIDHAAIFLMIAGTSTPVMWHALAGTPRLAMLATLWGATAIGIVFRVAWMKAPRWSYTAAYVAMGWLTLLRWRDVVQGTPSVALGLVIAGGIVYMLGALVYATKWPDPLPQRFGFHEIWHLFVLAGSALHFAAIVLISLSPH